MSLSGNDLISKSLQVDLVKNLIFNDDMQDKFYQIYKNVKQFNIFGIVGMENQEIKHSNTLAWLFGNNEHGLENKFFTEFLKQTIISTQINDEYYNNMKINIDKLREYIYLSKIKFLEIRREYKNIDLLIIDHHNKFAFLIENKLFSKESKNQLSTYVQTVGSEFANYNCYFILLTKDLDEPNEDFENGTDNQNKFLLSSYENIFKIINTFLDSSNKGRFELRNEIKLILDNYKDLLIRSGIVMDQNLSNLCNEIWSNNQYKEALDILFMYKPDNVSGKLDMKLKIDEEIVRLDSNGRKRRAFIPVELKANECVNELNKCIDSDKESGFWKENALIFRIYIEDNYLEYKLILNSSHITDKKLLNEFRNKLSKIPELKSAQNRLFSNKYNYNSIEQIETAVDKLINDAKCLSKKMLSVLT